MPTYVNTLLRKRRCRRHFRRRPAT